MAYVTLNGFDVEHASSLVVMENLIPQIQHINGKGVTDKYTKTDSIRNVTLIDVMRVLPYSPRFRKLGAKNGKYHNEKNVGGVNNSPQSEHYTIPVDLWYDEGVLIASPQDYANPINLQNIVQKQIVYSAGESINVITFAKQYEGFFRDSFGDTPTQEEIDNAVFSYNAATASNLEGSAVDAFVFANSTLSDGVPEMGLFQIPVDERQAFITNNFNRVIKRQYQTNASEAAAMINASGFINPFTESEDVRINTSTGLAGMYDGVPLFIFNRNTRRWVYVALNAVEEAASISFEGTGVTGATVDVETLAGKVDGSGTYEFTYDGTNWKLEGENAVLAEYGIAITGTAANGDKLTAVYVADGIRELLERIDAFIVAGAGTVRGIVGPNVIANPQPFTGGVYILPQMKIGVEVLNGKTIKMITKEDFTADEIKLIKSIIEFTPIDGVDVTGSNLYGAGVYNDGTTN